MNNRSIAVMTIIAGVFVLPTAPLTFAGDGRNYDITVTPAAAAELKDNESSGWNPLRIAKRATGKLAGAVASGARKITKGITGTVTGLFGGEEGANSKQTSEPA